MTAPRKPAAPRRSPARPVALPEAAAPVPVAEPAVSESAVSEPVVVLATVEPVAEAPAPFVPRFFSFIQGSTPMTNVEQTFATAKEQFEKFSQRFLGGFGGYGDLASVGRENIEAFVKASTIWAKGTEEIGKSVAALTQAQVEASLATTKALLGVTNFKQALEIQNEAAKTSLDKLMAEGNKITELSMKVANEAIEPIQARVTVAVEKILKPAA